MGQHSRRARVTGFTCEQLEHRQLLSAAVGSKPTPRHPTPGAPIVKPTKPAEPNLGTIRGSAPIFTKNTVPRGASELRIRFTIATPMQLTFTLSNVTSGASATLLNRFGKGLGHVSQAAPLVTSLAAGDYVLSFTSGIRGTPASFALAIQQGSTAAPAKVEAIAWGGNSAQVRWLDKANNELGYRVEVSDASTPGVWRKAAVAGSNHTAAVVKGLTPGHKYRFRVATVGGSHQTGTYTLAASAMSAVATTSTTDTSGFYKVSNPGDVSSPEAGWEYGSGKLTVKEKYKDKWFYATSWQAAVNEAVTGRIIINKNPSGTAPHDFGTGGYFEVDTAAELYSRYHEDGNELDSTSDAKLIALEDSYGTIDGDYDDFVWPVNVAYKPAVSIEVIDGEASEAWGDDAVIRLRRSGPTTEPLSVEYVPVGGSAHPSDDFRPSVGGYVDIPAGQQYLDVLVLPSYDGEIEETENILLAVEAEEDSPYMLLNPAESPAASAGFGLSTVLAAAEPTTTPATSQAVEVKVLQPIVKVAGVEDLWWFAGEDAQNYKEQIQLLVDANGWDAAIPRDEQGQKGKGEITWEVVEGQAKVDLVRGATRGDELGPLTALDVRIAATEGSDPKKKNDVKVHLKVDGNLVNELLLTVLTPASIKTVDHKDVAYEIGYRTTYTLEILDQYGVKLPRAVELNENFGNWTTDLQGETWTPGKANGELVDPQFTDTYQRVFTEQPNHPRYQTAFPSSVTPQDPAAQTKIEHVEQYYHVGSTDPGKGVKVRTHKLQIYRGYARQE